MKVAFVIPGGGGGGVRSVVRIATGLAERGHKVKVLYRSTRPAFRDIARRLYLGLRYGRRSDWLRDFPGEAQAYRRLSPGVVGRNDIVVGVGVACVLEIADLPPECGTKVHNSRGLEPWIPAAMNSAWSLPMPRIVVGRHLIDLMRQQGSRDPIYLAHNGVDRHEYFPTVLPQTRTGLGAVFHGADVKDPQMLFEVLGRVAKLCPAMPLNLFGSFPRPRSMPRCVAYTRLPRLPVARGIYSRSLIWILTSRNEGLPNPLLEAMACGCSVVSTDCGGATDIIQHERSGLIVPCDDADAMVSAICRLLSDAALRSRLQIAAAATLDEFTWPKAVDAFESALRQIAQRGDQSPALDSTPDPLIQVPKVA